MLIFVDNIDDLISSSEKVVEKYGEITVPTEEEKEIDITKEETSKFFKVVTGKSFTPVFKFYNIGELGEEINITLKILDKDRNELQSININETNENGTNDINGTFIFNKTKIIILKFHPKISEKYHKCVTFKYMNWNDGLQFLKR